MGRILIVEDEAHIARVMTMWLERHGHEIIHASNGTTALDVLSRESVDLIISDMNMPGLDGLGLVKAVREDRQRTLPILLVTARCDQAKLAEELEPYDVRLYRKPFVPSRLVADIERMLQITPITGSNKP